MIDVNFENFLKSKIFQKKMEEDVVFLFKKHPSTSIIKLIEETNPIAKSSILDNCFKIKDEKKCLSPKERILEDFNDLKMNQIGKKRKYQSTSDIEEKSSKQKKVNNIINSFQININLIGNCGSEIIDNSTIKYQISAQNTSDEINQTTILN